MRKTQGMLGLAARAGKIVTGQDSVESAVKRKKAFVALVDAGASPRTKKDIRDACEYAQVTMIEMEADLIGFSIGKPGRMCAAVTDASLAKRIKELYDEETNGSTTCGGAL